jgi:very-short-patch-repair endonuclease
MGEGWGGGDQKMPSMTKRAKELRKNMTDAEKKIWQMIRKRQILGNKFRRQVPIGPYIADFVCFEKKVIVEIDGGQHKTREGYDQKRTKWFQSQGFRVIRFWNNDVLKNIEGVTERLYARLGGFPDHPHPNPPPSRGRE